MKPNERSRHHSRVAWISSSARLESVAFVEHTVEAVNVSAWLEVVDGVDEVDEVEEGLTRSLCVVVSIDTRHSGGVYAHRNDSMKSIMLLAGVAECRGGGSIQSRHEGKESKFAASGKILYIFCAKTRERMLP